MSGAIYEDKKVEFEDELKEEEVIQLVGFKLGDEEYAIDILKVQEIIKMVEITTVPRVDHFVLGVMNLRGKVIPVVDLRLRFNLDKSDFDKDTRIIVVNFEKESIGFVVDKVTEVMRITKSIVEPTPPLVGTVGQEYILGICKYRERLIILLDIDRVIYGEKAGESSDLSKKFFSKVEEHVTSDVEENTETTAVEEGEEPTQVMEEKSGQSEQSEVVQEESSGVDVQKEEEVVAELTDSSDVSNTAEVVENGNIDIDALIAEELAKREKETEELIKKKKNKQLPSEEEVLEDALKQSEEILTGDEEHVSQDDLDALIAEELAKREKETEELVKRRKEKKKLSDSEKEDVDAESIDTSESENGEDDLVVKRDSLKELKVLAEKIINGEEQELDINIKGEIGELLKLLVKTKKKVDEVEPAVNDSSKNIPQVKGSLDNVTEHTESAAFNLMNNVEKMLDVYRKIGDKISMLEKAVNDKDRDASLNYISEVEEDLSLLDNMGFEMLNALEFQDITEQQITKIINYTEEIGAKFGAILGYMKVKQMKGEDISVSQEEVDKLLSDFGLN